MSGFAHHKGVVKTTQIGISTMQGEQSETLAGTGFNKGATKKPFEEFLFPAEPLGLKSQQGDDVFVTTLWAQGNSPFEHFLQDRPKMSPFLGDNGCKLLDNPRVIRILHNQRNARGRSLLLTKGVIHQNVGDRLFGNCSPSRISGQFEAQHV